MARDGDGAVTQEIDDSAVEDARLDYEHFRADALERVSSAAEFARSGLRAMMLGNGGAVVALFTFIGNVGDSRRLDAEHIWWAFACFIAGLTSVFAATIGAYLAQSAYLRSSVEQAWNAQKKISGIGEDYDFKETHREGQIAEWVTLGLTVVSLILFAIGSGQALLGVLP